MSPRCRRLRDGAKATGAHFLIAFGWLVASAADESRWFPTQAEPKVLNRTVAEHRFPEPRLASQMMMQSVAGLAAKSVNERLGDELVWVDTRTADVNRRFDSLRRDRPHLRIGGALEPWDIVDHFRQKGIVKGYILYRLDRSPGALNEHRSGVDCSVNVATSLSGLLDGILIDESLEQEAQQHGLAMLLDVRDKTQAWCFENYKSQFNRRLLCTQDPKKPHVRDLAISQRALPWVFQALIPDKERGTALCLHNEDRELWRKEAPESPPSAADVSAHVDRRGNVHVTWKLPRGEQDNEVWIRANATKRQMPQILHVAHGSGKVQLGPDQLSPGKLKIDAVVQNGFDRVTSKPVTIDVPDRPPSVAILHPFQDRTVIADRTLRLHGMATSADGTPVDPQKCFWRVGRKKVSRGLDAYVQAPPTGDHDVTLVAKDDGGSSEQTVRIHCVSAQDSAE